MGEGRYYEGPTLFPTTAADIFITTSTAGGAASTNTAAACTTTTSANGESGEVGTSGGRAQMAQAGYGVGGLGNEVQHRTGQV